MNIEGAAKYLFENVVIQVACILIGIIGDQKFFLAPKVLERHRMRGSIHHYIARARTFLIGVETMLKMIRNVDELLRGMPVLHDYPQRPRIHLGLLREIIERVRRYLIDFDPYYLKDYANRLQIRVKQFMPPLPINNHNVATRVLGQIEKATVAAVRPYLMTETTVSV